MITLNLFTVIGCGAGLLLAFILWSIIRDLWFQRRNRKNDTTFTVK